MITRILPREEWPRLAGTLLESAWPLFNDTTRVLAVERNGEIVGCVSLFQEWRLDGVWIAPAERLRVSVFRRLLVTLRTVLRGLHNPEVVMMARSAVGRRLCRSLGQFVHLDCEHYAVRLDQR